MKTSQLRSILKEMIVENMDEMDEGIFQSRKDRISKPATPQTVAGRQQELEAKKKAGKLTPEEDKELMSLYSRPISGIETKPTGGVKAVSAKLEEEEEKTIQEMIDEWQAIEETWADPLKAPPPPLPGSPEAQKAEKNRKRAEELKKSVEAMRAKHQETSSTPPPPPSASTVKESKKISVDTKEFLEILNECVQEVIQERKKAGKKLPAFLLKKKNQEKDKKDNSKKKDSKNK